MFLSKFISAYQKSYRFNHVLTRLIESSKKSLDQKTFVSAVLMDLSRAFDSILHDPLIEKLHDYGFSKNSLVFFYSYLKRRKQNVRINNTHGIFQILLSSLPQRPILEQILFIIFINDLFLWISNSELLNFTDDKTICMAENIVEELISTLEKESQAAIGWFKSNKMIVNPNKFQAINAKRNKKMRHSYPVNINQEVTTLRTM